MGPSMRDVAARAGVSPKTVSNVVRGWPNVTDETRARVNEALEALGYRMNLSARMLRSGRSGMLALAVPYLAVPYFAELTSGIVRVAEARGWTVQVEQTDGSLDHELRVLQGARGNLIDGLILSPYAAGPEHIAARTAPTPLVLLGERIGHGAADHVAVDNVSAARDMVSLLVSRGYRRIAAIGLVGGATGQHSRMRLEGYEQALARAGLPLVPEHQRQVSEFGRAEGARAMDELLDLPERPDAVFCFDDLLALGALHAAHERGVRVPDEIAVAGFDDIEESRYCYPTLTTVRPDKEALARQAVELVLARLDAGDSEPPRSMVPDYALVERDSTA
ncbi:DNA-binding LacI/PurR family transcriptional regulator [Motilibacter peucedani]|uniref:DNA-binding LacI/PurR family transcriptional regulator n=1 Tax=Motilibacter peucedani TaxID=598650 RepID=A0A420XU76_9ACTN|nr:LacI family DNA-binding transcriptional regulator [Motilibacter peucedani]RKS80209.1 DNA-binding LacI/PurR family transcriptional regulator [Motilibacter peucedani]